MINKEALARISINKLLEDAGWRFFPNEKGIIKVKDRSLDKISKRFNVENRLLHGDKF